MPLSISDQASSMVKGQESRINVRASITELDRMKQEADFASEAASSKQRNFMAIAEFNRSGAMQDKAQGEALKMQGNAKVATGAATMMIGFVMVLVGAAVPMAGPAMVIEGLGLVVKGGADVAMGMVDIEQGKQALMRYQQRLDLAVENNILGKEEGAIASKEMNRARIMEFKKEMMEELAEAIKPMLEQAGINSEEMTEDQLSKMMDKFMEDAGKCLANGGIMEVDLSGDQKEAQFTDEKGDELEGNFHFIRDEETGKFYKIELAYEQNGDPAKGALGQPLVDTSKGMVEVEDGDLKDYLKSKFLFVDKLKVLAKELSYVNFDPNEHVKLVPYDVNNTEHMREFADLIMKTNFEKIKSGAISSPLKYDLDSEGPFFQQWDWVKNVPVGPKVYIGELTGETKDMRSNIDNFQLALERSDYALKTLGIGAGGNVFKTLSTSSDVGLASKKTGDSKLTDITSRESQEFSSFKSVTSTFDILRSQNNILESSSADDLPDGLA